jgi:hypothetical protein
MFISRHAKRTITYAVTTFCLTSIFSQANPEGIEINGYAQSYCAYYKVTNPPPSMKSSTFNVQEMDLILQKDLGSALSTFADLQFLNTYSTEKGWGDLNLDQMWIKYSPAKEFNIKFGHIVPIFNSFNEIKTKFPLLPYIFRPLVYESSISAVVNSGEYIPMHAAIQINGTVKLNILKLDYAVFGGNSDFIISSKMPGASIYTFPGEDTTNFKLFGGRIGARFAGIKIGFSYTNDKSSNYLANGNITSVNVKLQQRNSVSPQKIPLVNKIGNSDRNRFGVDLSYSNFGLTLESEYIYMMNTLEEVDKQSIKYLCSLPLNNANVKMFSEDLSRHFFYVNANYDILEKFFITAGYSYLRNHFDLAVQKYGLTQIMGGGGFRMNDNVTLKAQCLVTRNDLSSEPYVKFNNLIASIGASVYF